MYVQVENNNLGLTEIKRFRTVNTVAYLLCMSAHYVHSLSNIGGYGSQISTFRLIL